MPQVGHGILPTAARRSTSPVYRSEQRLGCKIRFFDRLLTLKSISSDQKDCRAAGELLFPLAGFKCICQQLGVVAFIQQKAVYLPLIEDLLPAWLTGAHGLEVVPLRIGV